MKAPPFSYVRAGSLIEALQALSQPDAKAIAGGQSLLAALAFRLSAPSVLVDIARLAELGGITETGSHLRIGALTTHAEITRHDLIRRHAPLLAEAAALIGHPAIRNRGTIGGSLAYADPAAEYPAAIMALDAHIIVASASGEQRIAASQFFTGLFSTVLADGALIVAVEVPRPQPNEVFAIEEIARRSGDYAMAGVAIRMTFEDGQRVGGARMACFAVGDAPVLATKAAATLIGHPLTPTTIAAACDALAGDLDPPADMHGGPAFKQRLATVVVGRALQRIADKRQAP